MGESFVCSEMLGRKHERKERAHTHTHSEVERTGHLQTNTHRLHDFTETWHLRERSYLCSRWQVGSNSSSFQPGVEPGSPAPQEERAEVCPSLLPHSCPALQPRVTSWRPNHGHPGCGLSEATGSRCLAPLRPRCSWRPAAPARLGPQPESVLASRRSGRQNAACSTSGRPEPGNRV